MRYAGGILVLLGAACAAPPPAPDFRIDPMPSERGAFAVSDFRGEPETRRYKVKPEELLASSATAEFDGRPSDGRLILPPTDSIEDLTAGALAGAVLVIRTLVAPESWTADPRCALYVEKDEIVVRHAPKVLLQIERLIETLKENRKTVIRLRTLFLTMPLDEMRAIKHLPMIREGLGGVIDKGEVEALKSKIGLRTRTLLTAVPAMSLHHGQPGVVTLGSRFPYIKSYKPDATDKEAVVDVVSTGLELRLRAIADGPRSDRFLVDAAIEVQQLASFTNVLLADHMLQIPATLKNVAAGQFVLGPDQAAVLLVPGVRSSNGILGALGGTPSKPTRMTLVILALDRVE